MKRIFLLGGHDLEMMEIRGMLENAKEAFFDKGLCWKNAELDAYSEEMSQYPDVEYVCIELRDKSGLTKKYHCTIIDHHNENDYRPAAILQVAMLLGVVPDRHMRLVAANDAGYIPAMRDMGASDDEIAEIRHRDRVAQGITALDEQLAEQSVAERLTIYGDTLIVNSLTERFSAICDRLFPYRRLLVYTSDEWVFYGDGKMELVSTFADDIEKGKVYHGGGVNGYVGAAQGVFSPQEILDFVTSVKQRYE